MKTEQIDPCLLRTFGVAKKEGIFPLEAAAPCPESLTCHIDQLRRFYRST